MRKFKVCDAIFNVEPENDDEAINFTKIPKFVEVYS
jgi:hypothetical protein